MSYINTLILILSICMGFYKAEAQPLKTPHEVVIEVHNLNSCFDFKCSQLKVSGSVLSGKVGALQVLGAYRFTGDKGKIGAQSWLRLNKYSWLGAQTLTSLNGEIEHELMLSLDLNYKEKIEFLPYISIFLNTEHFGGVGFKTYIDKTIAFGLEFRAATPDAENYDLVFMVSAALSSKTFDINKFLGLTEDKKEGE